MKCRLGQKKQALVQKLLSWKVDHCFVRGGWEHGICQVQVSPPDTVKRSFPNSLFSVWVDYRNGKVIEWDWYDSKTAEEMGDTLPSLPVASEEAPDVRTEE